LQRHDYGLMLLLLNLRDFRRKHRLRQKGVNKVWLLIVRALSFTFAENFPWGHHYFIDLSKQIVLAMTFDILEAELALR
jgi:hypothetical protein